MTKSIPRPQKNKTDKQKKTGVHWGDGKSIEFCTKS